MRRLAVLLLLATAGALIPASSADAYRLLKHRWYSKTLTYYDATNGKYRAEIRAAVRVLNRSGARIKIRSASRRTARVRVSVSSKIRSAGQARYRIPRNRVVRNARILLRNDLAGMFVTPGAAEVGITAVVAHEFAHVLGLDHEDRRCATMNSKLWEHCRRPPANWQYRCRVLERDDVRGLVRRFGGRVRSVGADHCDAEAAPAAPAPVTVARDPASGYVAVTWTDGAIPVSRAEVMRKAGGCPTGSGDPTATLIARVATAPGKANVIHDLPATAGAYCYAVVGLGPLGRPGPPGGAVFNHLAEPVARFTGAWTNENTVLQLQDQSIDHDGQIVAWSWNFGDGTTSTQQHPRKSWRAPGVYTVTLTVRDNSGHVGTHSLPVTIQGASNRGTMASH